MTAPPRYACRVCGQWICGACGWKRSNASTRYTDHSCSRCGCRTGTLVPTMHTEIMWWKHNYRDTGGLYKDMVLPKAYPYGAPADPDEYTEGYGQQTARTAPRVYEGVPVPVTGPYQMLDLKSWQRGVGDALKRAQAVEYRTGLSEGYDIGYAAALRDHPKDRDDD
jgi:hypothetical protein